MRTPWSLATPFTPVIMGILNVTPDSFSDGGRFIDPAVALAHAESMLAEGADIIDVGGESTRPQGAHAVEASEERRRVEPVIRAIVRARPSVLVSVDTTKRDVASAAIDAGAAIVNDVSGMRLDAGMAALCATRDVSVVLMHSRGSVEEMATYAHAHYDGDPLDTVIRELGECVARAMAAGIARESIALDPGIGFAKRAEHSLRVLAGIDRVLALGHPVLVGASRKRFLAQADSPSEPSSRVNGSVGAAVAAYVRGVRFFRVHDVAAHRQALDVAAAIEAAGAPTS
ncbi:MAG: dihydropteroate synthase [Gemmatimonadaceae bacterium]|nr:dihydropteroate synthase [Gemmatimonadaceae bacterium]